MRLHALARSQIHKRKPKGSGHERPGEILDAAQRLVLRDGIGSVTMRAIAAEIGVSSTALYVYFPTREAILLALCDRTLGKLLVRFGAIEAGPGTHLEKLRTFMANYVAFGQAHPDEYRLVFEVKSQGIGPMSHLAEPTPAAGNVGPQLFGKLLDQVKRLIAEGTFADHDPVTAAETIWMLGHGMIMLTTSMPHFPWKDPAVAVAATTDLALSGLLKRR